MAYARSNLNKMGIKDSILKVGDVVDSMSEKAKSAGNYANKMQSLISSGDLATPSKIRALYTNGFFAQDSLFTPQFFVRAFDEPTYLTFRIEFITNDKRNTAYNNAGLMGLVGDSAGVYYNMYDYMPEPFLQDFGYSNHGDASYGRTYSSETYLDINLGDHGRAAMLHNFKAALKDIEKNFPFYFKSISGLSSLTTVNPTHGARVKDAVLTLDCLEGLDLKITQLLNMYRKIVWDDTYQRWVLPDMMRYFGMRIYISEIRLFHSMKKGSSWKGLNIDPFQKNSESGLYDFRDANVRNAYSLPLNKSNTWDSLHNAISTGTAVSNTFLGTQSNITKAMENVSGIYTGITDTMSEIDDMFNDVMLCNNAINEVMPTICLECHLCEFDISETMEHIGQLYNNNKETKELSAKIKIKVGQVQEKHAYPLNRFLDVVNDHYGISRLSNFDKTQIRNIKNAKEINDLRNQSIGYAGQYVSDEILNKRYKDWVLGGRLNEYNEFIENYMNGSGVSAETISRKRLGKALNNEIDTLDYSKEKIPETLAATSLATAFLNEGASLSKKWGKDPDYLFGGQFVYPVPPNPAVATMQAIGETLKNAADKIYNGTELKSLCLSDYMKNAIATKLFDDYINELDRNAGDNGPLRQIINSYKTVTDTGDKNTKRQEKLFSAPENGSGIFDGKIQPINNGSSEQMTEKTKKSISGWSLLNS